MCIYSGISEKLRTFWRLQEFFYKMGNITNNWFENKKIGLNFFLNKMMQNYRKRVENSVFKTTRFRKGNNSEKFTTGTFRSHLMTCECSKWNWNEMSIAANFCNRIVLRGVLNDLLVFWHTNLTNSKKSQQ